MKKLFFVLYFLLSINLYGSLTLEEKIGQLLIVHFHGEHANEDAQRLIEEARVGGFIYYDLCNGLADLKQVQNLSRGLQKLSKIPLWIASDEEGGPVSRIKGLEYFPGNRRLADLGNPYLVRDITCLGGRELKDLGINMNLAPVVDISSHPEKSFMAKRTFGNSPSVVTHYARHVLKGYKKAGILPVLKHFPGYGDTEMDPHLDLPVLNKKMQDLENVELVPYIQLLGETEAIMTAHILVPALDPLKCATLSEAIVKGLLRQKMGYEGLVITDSLTMQGLLNNCGSLEKAALEALLAGCDLLILGRGRLQHGGDDLKVEDILRIFHFLVQEAEEGRLPLKIVDQAVARTLHFKEKFLKP
jgi:beta-N-acetylhexosaminidase